MINKICEVGHNISKKHWIAYTIITFLPTVWFSLIISYFGISLKLIEIKNDQESFTVIGLIFTILVVLIPLFIAIINNWYSSKSETSELEHLNNEKIFYEQLNKSIDIICEDKLKRLNATIVSLKNNNRTLPPDIVSNPSNQLKRIIEQINECLCVFLKQPNENYNHKDFYITLAYNFPTDDNKWRWLEGTEEKGLTLDVLLNNNNKSTFNYILNNNKPYYFNNDKKIAKQEDCYIYDPTDQLNMDKSNEVGSIFCCRFMIKKNNKIYVDSILSVSTYKKKFLNLVGNDERSKRLISNVEENLLLIVKDYFGKRIGIELSLLYLEYLHNTP